MLELETNREVAGRYRIVRLLGKGGMGAVYEVEHLHTGQRLALKVLTAQHQVGSIERFKREARVASRIQSDHVVRVTDADVAPELDGAPFLVMELLDGSDLERATGDAPAAPADVVEWLRQVARALVKAHEAGIVHRDLKPENLFLTRREDGTPLVKILDFGIARMAAEAAPLTHSGQFLGTPQYMAPEQTDNHGATVTERADIWALGLVAFRLLTGHSYWKPGSLAQLLAQILTEPMVAPSTRGSGLGPELDAWFLRSCDREPERRFSSATEQVEALAAALGLPAQARAPTPAAVPVPVPAAAVKTFESAPTLDASSRELTTVKARGRWRWGVTAAAAGGLALAGALFLSARGREPAPALAPAPPPSAASSLPTSTAAARAEPLPAPSLAAPAVPDAAAAPAPPALTVPSTRAASRPVPAPRRGRARSARRPVLSTCAGDRGGVRAVYRRKRVPVRDPPPLP